MHVARSHGRLEWPPPRVRGWKEYHAGRVDVCVDDPALTGSELTSLLVGVYVGGGFTDESVAPALFQADVVRKRGTILTAREDGALAGIVILVEPGNDAIQIARHDECEIHLLAVRKESRGRGVGVALLNDVLELARTRGWRRVALSTQESMTAAHRLYTKAGFERAPERDWTRRGRRFLAYERALV